MATKKQQKLEEDIVKRNVFIIKPPHNNTPYVLLVTRSGGMMGTQTAAFGVDRIITEVDGSGKALDVRGVTDNPHHVVVQFPVGTPFLLVERSNMRMLTQIELAKEHKEEEAELETVFAPKEGEVAALPTAIGQGQYL